VSNRLSANFTREEFACKCGCGFNTADSKLVWYLQSIRDYFGAPVKINSAARCASHNAAVGGSDKSQHLLGRAADIAVKGVECADVAKYARDVLECEGVGEYEAFVHIDSRNGKARW